MGSSRGKPYGAALTEAIFWQGSHSGDFNFAGSCCICLFAVRKQVHFGSLALHRWPNLVSVNTSKVPVFSRTFHLPHAQVSVVY